MARSHDDRPPVAPGRVVLAYSRAEAADLAEKWLAAFAGDASAPGMRRYLWHIFSYESTPALSLGPACDQYALETAAEYVVLSNERDVAFVTDQRPTASSLRDWFVFPPNMAWTMAFTHEDGWLGPYFVRHPQYATRNAENQARLKKQREADQALARKQREIEDAKKRGWA